MRWLAVLGLALAAAAPAAAGDAGPVYAGVADDFVAAHGERALVMGYPAGLEVWAYPLQILSGYRLSFRVGGSVEPIDGAALLKRVEHRPEGAIRVYIGPDFVVREHLFVARREAAAILRYEVEGRPDVRIAVRFQPSLDLMWPGALGGQTIGWDGALNGYVEREALHGFAATIVSPDAVEHDAVVNRTRPTASGVGMVLAPRGPAGGVRTAALYVVGKAATAAEMAGLASRSDSLRQEASAHAAAVLAEATEIVTPDADANRALASAVLALDQAWVCSDALGCGLVAGYGPSRPGRRPQYAWFFAGDGLVQAEALLAAGEYARARDELAFIARYQDRRTGMIWHELSQSAPLLDWARYPYMFVHVDISFQYLATAADYVRTSGDTGFARASWPGLAAAWRYCTALVDASGLPHIPAGKSGQNEQDALSDDIRLSTLWIDAADGFGRLAAATGHDREAREAAAAAARARQALGRSGWDTAQDFWLSGHTAAGEPVHGARPDASGVLLQDVFTPAQASRALDRLAGPEFITDWGMRSLSAAAAGYDPNLYGSGSVWALGTAGMATTFWRAHRPLAALGLWQGLVAWNTLDSRGHLHEVLAGDLFHPEVESVPEQSWSSASVLTSTITGLLGLGVRSAERAVDFAPHLPPEWPGVTVRRVRVGTTPLTMALTQGATGIDLHVDNPEGDIAIDFAPGVPLGARASGATLDGAPLAAETVTQSGDTQVRARFTAHHGTTTLHIGLAGGVAIAVPRPALVAGDSSRGLKIVTTTLNGDTLTVAGWVTAPEEATFTLTTPWRLLTVAGARATPLGEGRIAVTFDPPTVASAPQSRQATAQHDIRPHGRTLAATLATPALRAIGSA